MQYTMKNNCKNRPNSYTGSTVTPPVRASLALYPLIDRTKVDMIAIRKKSSPMIPVSHRSCRYTLCVSKVLSLVRLKIPFEYERYLPHPIPVTGCVLNSFSARLYKSVLPDKVVSSVVNLS